MNTNLKNAIESFDKTKDFIGMNKYNKYWSTKGYGWTNNSGELIINIQNRGSEFPLLTMTYYYPNKDLREFLRNNNKRVSGNKKTLIRRIFKEEY